MIRKIALIASLAMIFTIPWETAITIRSLGTLTRLIGFGVAGIWAVSVLIKGNFRNFTAYHIAVISFMLYNVASLFWTVNYNLTLDRIKTYIQLAILTWILWDLFTTPESLRKAMQVFIFGAYLTIASQLANFLSGQTIAAYSDGRFSGAGQNAVELALIFSLSLPLAWHLATTQKPGPGAIVLRVVNFAYIPMALLATILTASRTSVVTNIPGLLYIVGTMRRIKPQYRGLIFILIVTTFIVVQPMIPRATLDRLSTIGVSITGSDLGGRMKLWKDSLSIFLAHPILGIGSNTLSTPSQLGAYAHNTYLSILTELGLVGLFLFLGVLAFVVYQAIKQPAPYSTLWITVTAVWMIGVLTLSWEYTKATWFFLNLVIISAGIYRHRNQSEPAPPISLVSSVDPDAQAA